MYPWRFIKGGCTCKTMAQQWDNKLKYKHQSETCLQSAHWGPTERPPKCKEDPFVMQSDDFSKYRYIELEGSPDILNAMCFLYKLMFRHLGQQGQTRTCRHHAHAIFYWDDKRVAAEGRIPLFCTLHLKYTGVLLACPRLAVEAQIFENSLYTDRMIYSNLGGCLIQICFRCAKKPFRRTTRPPDAWNSYCDLICNIQEDTTGAYLNVASSIYGTSKKIQQYPGNPRL